MLLLHTSLYNCWESQFSSISEEYFFTNLTHPQANRLELVWNWTSSLRLFTETLRSGFSFLPRIQQLVGVIQSLPPAGEARRPLLVVNVGVNLDLPLPKRTQETCHFEPSHGFTRRQRHINTDDISFSCDYNVPSCGGGAEMNVFPNTFQSRQFRKKY